MRKKINEERYRDKDMLTRSESRTTLLTGLRKVSLTLFFLLTMHSVLMTPCSRAEIYDHVVAFVDDRAITLSEFKDQYARTREVIPNVSEEEVINTMVNRLLMLKEARQYRIEAPTEDAVIKEFVDLKVRAFITVGEDEIEVFYEKNREQFAGRSLESARGEIEQYLTEKELNARLKAILVELRKKAYIKIQFRPGE